MPIALLIMLLLGGGTGLASGAALPGDLLYPIKIHVNESFESAFAFSPEKKEKIEIEHVSERIKEVDKLTKKGLITIEKNKELKGSFEQKIKEITQGEDNDDDEDESHENDSNKKTEIKVVKKEGENKTIQTSKKSSVEKEDGDDDEEDEDDDDRRVTTNPTPTPAPQTTPTPSTSGTTVTSYTLAQVAIHNNASDCWSVVNGGVYNLTSWIGQHPGGQSAIKSMCGQDASADFNGQHGGQARPVSELAGFKIGTVK